MTILRWVLDSCPCVIEFDSRGDVFVKWESRCDEHKLLDNQALYDAILIHNNGYNNQYSVGPTPTERELEDEAVRITALKTSEQNRIRNAGPTETR